MSVFMTRLMAIPKLTPTNQTQKTIIGWLLAIS